MFRLESLFGERDVEIRFDSNVRILVAENGYGKTTILNALYFLLSGNLRRLRKIEFESLQVHFDSGEKFKIDRDELNFFAHSAKDSDGFYSHLCSIMTPQVTDDLISHFFDVPLPQFQRSSLFKIASKKSGFGEHTLLNFLKKFIGGDGGVGLDPKVKKKVARIRSLFPENILYLPTYRRVEIDLGVGDTEGEDYNNIIAINFGLRDVEELIKQITQEILTSSVEWFSKVNGQMLSQLVEGFKLDEKLKDSIRNPGAVKIVLDRIGDNIELETKQQILKLIQSEEIFKEHDPLIYFIANLVKVYEQQKENDSAIQAFMDVCNRYLGDKRIKYNESTVSVEVVRRKNEAPVLMESLSSGEKQIISLFAKLYLNKQKSFAVFFDEPELSLSMEWQKTLLPDILESGKCDFLFSTTHSPFIFQNSLKNSTVDLANYIKEL